MSNTPPWYATRLTVGTLTVFLSVVLAALAPNRVVGGTHELFGFAVWSVPLGAAVAHVARTWHVVRFPPLWRAAATGGVGFLLGVGWTMIGWMLVGGLMLAWDFPVLYCWSLGAALGMLFGAWAQHGMRPAHVALGALVAIAPLAAFAWQGSRPQPAVLVVYREAPGRDAAQLVLDSVLSEPHPSGVGRHIRWPYSSYSRTRYAGHVAALIVLHDADDRESLRAAATAHPLVFAVIDTMISRGQ